MILWQFCHLIIYNTIVKPSLVKLSKGGLFDFRIVSLFLLFPTQSINNSLYADYWLRFFIWEYGKVSKLLLIMRFRINPLLWKFSSLFIPLFPSLFLPIYYSLDSWTLFRLKYRLRNRIYSQATNRFPAVCCKNIINFLTRCLFVLLSSYRNQTSLLFRLQVNWTAIE